MRVETKFIREILRRKFPNQKFKFMYKEVENLCDTSDRLIVTIIDGDEDLQNKVCAYIKACVCGIVVYRHGEVASKSGRFYAKIILPETEEYLEPETLEFIEIKI